jgi:hypothetical protein
VTDDELIRRFFESGRRAQAAVNFEIAKAELRKLGITITQQPGEYHVSLTGGPDENVLTAETLNEAIALGLVAKAFAPATTSTAAASGKRYRRPRRMTPKAQRRRMIRQHNRRMRARATRRDKE